MSIVIIIYISALSFLLFLIMGIDKRKAKKGQWRISEKTIWILAYLGGACGGLVGMYIFRHKTKHPLFVYGLPILALLHFFTIFFVQQYFN